MISTTFTYFIFNQKAKTDPVAVHFKSAGHPLKDYKIVPLEKFCKNDFYRDTIEKLWINKIRTFKPFGINTGT